MRVHVLYEWPAFRWFVENNVTTSFAGILPFILYGTERTVD